MGELAQRGEQGIEDLRVLRRLAVGPLQQLQRPLSVAAAGEALGGLEQQPDRCVLATQPQHLLDALQQGALVAPLPLQLDQGLVERRVVGRLLQSAQQPGPRTGGVEEVLALQGSQLQGDLGAGPSRLGPLEALALEQGHADPVPAAVGVLEQRGGGGGVSRVVDQRAPAQADRPRRVSGRLHRLGLAQQGLGAGRAHRRLARALGPGPHRGGCGVVRAQLRAPGAPSGVGSPSDLSAKSPPPKRNAFALSSSTGAPGLIRKALAPIGDSHSVSVT